MPLLPYRLSLAALLLAVTLPFLGAQHYLPIATFRQEWLAGMLGLAALLPLALARDERPWSVPRSALLPLGLVVLVWLQLAAGIEVLFESALLLSLYLVWAFMLMLAAGRVAAGLGRDRLAAALAWALVAGALLAAGTAVLQRWGPAIGMPYIFPSATFSGNIAQTNNFADYLWLGIAAALYLHAGGRLGAASLALLLPVLLGCSLLSGSRSVYAYAVALTLWLAVWGFAERGPARRRRLIMAASLLPALVGLQLGIGFFSSGDGSVASAQRLAAQGSYDPVRLTLWRAALAIFADHPWLGAGFDSFSREYFARIERFPINGLGIPEHSHNLLTELLVEFGLAGGALLLATAAGWLLGLHQRPGDPAKYLAVGMLLVLGIHSALEYPLWYAHFLAIAACLLALGDGKEWRIEAAGRHRLALGAIALTGFVVLANLRTDYVSLEDAARGRSSDGTPLTREEQVRNLLQAYTNSLWRPYAALQFAAHMPIEAKEVEGRLVLMREAAHFSPIRESAFRHAALLQLAGRGDEARHQLLLAMRSYPGDIPAARALLQAAVRSEPALAPLVAMLDQRSF